MHAAVVALSEHYNAVLADRLTGTFGLGWEARDRGANRNPAWEIAGVGEELIARVLQPHPARSRWRRTG